MTTSIARPLDEIEYPDEDGKPMAEGDPQRNSLIDAVKVLEIFFQNRPDVYVSGNMLIYYEEGNSLAVVAPDVFVIFGVPKRQRFSYKVWQESNCTPDFVLEITSKSTRAEDGGAKKGIYAFLRVKEYFQYDPTGDYLNPYLQGFRLVGDNYFPIPAVALPDGTMSLRSEVLGLDLRWQPFGELGFYNPITGEKLLTHEESERARQQAEEARQRAEQLASQQTAAHQQAALLASQEAIARQAAEARIAELEAQLRSLQQKSE